MFGADAKTKCSMSRPLRRLAMSVFQEMRPMIGMGRIQIHQWQLSKVCGGWMLAIQQRQI